MGKPFLQNSDTNIHSMHEFYLSKLWIYVNILEETMNTEYDLSEGTFILQCHYFNKI